MSMVWYIASEGTEVFGGHTMEPFLLFIIVSVLQDYLCSKSDKHFDINVARW